MKTFYSQLLFMILGIVIGASQLIDLHIPVAATVSIVVVLMAICFVAIFTDKPKDYQRIYKYVFSLTFYLVTIMVIIALWIFYLKALYTSTVFVKFYLALKVPIMVIPLALCVVALSVVNDMFNRWLKNKEIK